jgi:hypothetical protein
MMDTDLLEPAATDAAAPADDRFPELMASIGYLMHGWHRLEAVLAEEIRRLRLEGGDTGKNLVRIRGSLSERLAEWAALLGLRHRGDRQFAQGVAELSAQIERLRRTRNMIAQSFAGATDGKDGAEPAILCADGDLSPPTTDPRRIPLGEVKQIIDQIETCRERIPNIEKKPA